MTFVSRVHVSGYRSIAELALPLHPISVFVGPNGCGKTNLYHALGLLKAAADGQLAVTLAQEGGMPSVLWAGTRERRKKPKPVRVVIEAALEELTYRLELGLPRIEMLEPPERTRFGFDPLIKKESIELADGTALLERGNLSAFLRDADGRAADYPAQLWPSESILAQLIEPQRFPIAAWVQRQLSSFRFYHHFRTDPGSPLRAPQVAARTAVLSDDGHDLANVLQTVRENGDDRALDRAVEAAFPGSRLEILGEDRLSVALTMPGVKRALDARELSDGTLRYLCLIAVLLSPRPPRFLALNEPETSIHPNLVGPLAALAQEAAARSQLWITTHSEPFARALAEHAGAHTVRLDRGADGTFVVDQGGETS